MFTFLQFFNHSFCNHSIMIEKLLFVADEGVYWWKLVDNDWTLPKNNLYIKWNNTNLYFARDFTEKAWPGYVLWTCVVRLVSFPLH